MYTDGLGRFRKLMTHFVQSSPFLKQFNQEPRFVKYVKKVIVDLVSRCQVGMEQLDYLVWERTTKGTPEQGRHGEGQRAQNSSQTSKECRLTGNIHTQRATALTRHDFHSWDNPSNTDSNSIRDWLVCNVAEKELNSVTHNKQTREVSPGLGPHSCFSCVISLLVLTAIVHSWVILACVLWLASFHLPILVHCTD